MPTLGPAKHHHKMTLTDIVTVTDSISTQANFKRSYTDTVNVTDSIKKALAKILTDTVTVTDAFSKSAGFKRSFTDTVTVTDTIQIQDLEVSVTTDTLLDFKTTTEERMDQACDLYQYTETVDAMGNITNIVKTTVPILAYLEPAGEAVREIAREGLITKGTVRGFFKVSYAYEGTTYYVEPGDEILRQSDGVTFRVIETNELKIENTGIFIEAVLKRIGND